MTSMRMDSIAEGLKRHVEDMDANMQMGDSIQDIYRGFTEMRGKPDIMYDQSKLVEGIG
ncbi:hypothetical protein A2U01_0092919 [Trifolium medium]|uniref:Uncharacterized protein n=1 Tax=Trifolium medium TaxID=97028 RepID=A0A392UGU8_9FABA|nr:hypothetical protein [Trifolium medium]